MVGVNSIRCVLANGGNATWPEPLTSSSSQVGKIPSPAVHGSRSLGHARSPLCLLGLTPALGWGCLFDFLIVRVSRMLRGRSEEGGREDAWLRSKDQEQRWE